MTQERYNIFVGKDVWEKVEMSCDSPKEIDDSMQQQIPKRYSDVPITIFRSDTLEALPSSHDGLGHDLLRNHPQYTERKSGSRSHRPWRMVVTNIEMPTMDQVIRDATRPPRS